MDRVTVRIPATSANLGPGFDTFGCALTLYNDLTFERAGQLEITGCDAQFAGPDNLAYAAYCAALDALGVQERGVRIHIDAHIPVCRGLGSSAALLAAGAVGANLLHCGGLTKADLLRITTPLEGHPDNLAPALYGGFTASMTEGGAPLTAHFPVHPDWVFLALIPDFNLSTRLARSVLPQQVDRADAVYNVAHGAMVLKALELGDEALLRPAMGDRIHQPYRKTLIADFERIEARIHANGAAFCLSGAGPTLLCVTKNPALKQTLEAGLAGKTEKNWRILSLRLETEGARVLTQE